MSRRVQDTKKLTLVNDVSSTVKLYEQVSKMKDETKMEKEEKKAFMRWMKDPLFKAYLTHTLDFFGDTPGAFAAAKFVSLTLRFDGSQVNFNLMGRTMNELKMNSDALYSTLQSKATAINVSPYFESRMLNLVHNLEVNSSDKISFYSKFISKAPKSNKDGTISDESIAFETALILAKQTTNAQDPALISSVMNSWKSASNDLEKKIIKERVNTYFPELYVLFN